MAKKDKKPKLPKRVGGVKLPKQLRKSAEVVAEIAQNPIAREVVSAALAAGASALAKRKVNNAVGLSAPAGSTPARPDLVNLIARGTEIGEILSKGVTAFVAALTTPAERVPAPPAVKAPTTSKPRAQPAARVKAGVPAARTRAKPTSGK